MKEECPEARIVLHLDFGTDAELYERWFDAIEPFDIDYDIIGMSYYPHWNGGLNLLLDNMNRVSQKYGKDVMIAETSIGYTTDTLGCTGLVFTQELEKIPDILRQKRVRCNSSVICLKPSGVCPGDTE